MALTQTYKNGRDDEREKIARWLDGKAEVFRGNDSWTGRMLRNYARSIRSNEHGSIRLPRKKP